MSTCAALPYVKRCEARERLILAVQNGKIKEDSFVPLEKAIMHLPMEIKGCTDFLCSKEHLSNVSKLTSPGKATDAEFRIEVLGHKWASECKEFLRSSDWVKWTCFQYTTIITFLPAVVTRSDCKGQEFCRANPRNRGATTAAASANVLTK